jgi:thiol:disulfide interchange protein DsbA
VDDTAAPPATRENDPLRMAQELDQAETSSAPPPDDDGESLDAEPVVVAQQEATPNFVERFQQGRHYTTLAVAQPTSVGPDKVEVVEVFWYGCPHCYTLDPYVKAWLAKGLPENVEFVRVHAALNRGWQVHARVFYTAEALGILDEVHDDLFREIHVNRNPLNTQERLVEFFAAHGVSESDFLDAFNSMGVQTNLRRADAQVRRYRITGVPAIVVNGKYVTGADKAGGYEQLFEVIEFLIAKETQRGGHG